MTFSGGRSLVLDRPWYETNGWIYPRIQESFDPVLCMTALGPFSIFSARLTVLWSAAIMPIETYLVLHLKIIQVKYLLNFATSRNLKPIRILLFCEKFWIWSFVKIVLRICSEECFQGLLAHCTDPSSIETLYFSWYFCDRQNVCIQNVQNWKC